jgi:hypothetical protein
MKTNKTRTNQTRKHNMKTGRAISNKIRMRRRKTNRIRPNKTRAFRNIGCPVNHETNHITLGGLCPNSSQTSCVYDV